MKAFISIGLSVMAMFLLFCSFSSGGETPAKKSAKLLRVGVYDSRAVAVAYAHSEWNRAELKERMKEMEKAKAAGDEKKVEELKAWGQQRQQKIHLQGFGSAPVQDLLKPVHRELAAVAGKAGVDLIVSKWQIDYQSKDAELVDVTDALVSLYKPNEKTLKIIQDIKTRSPLSEEEILKHKD